MAPELDLAGKRVLVTGGASGIGAALAEGFAGAGAAVAIQYRSSADAAAAMAERLGGKLLALEADLTEPGEAGRVVGEVERELGGIDVLVNNAGTLVGRATAAEMDDAYFRAVVDVNLYSTIACTRAAVPQMKARGSGSIVNMTSVAARNGGGPGAALYASVKAAVSTYTRGVAKELAPFGIRVNALSPGIVDTPFHERYSTPESFAALVSGVPMGRAASAEEMVGPTLFLASDSMSGYVTGHILEVNGGMYSP
jgi:3-oxoacyl-[acyl-carrier protein] reductase